MLSCGDSKVASSAYIGTPWGCARPMHGTDSRPRRVCGESQLRQGSDYVAVSTYRVRDSARRQGAPLSRAADRESFDPERRLADADGDAVSTLAAGSNTVVELQIVADHRDARQHVRTIADQGRALEGRAHAAVLDGIRLARREHELAGGDIHLAAAEIDRVNAPLHRADDFLRRMRTGPHVGVGH